MSPKGRRAKILTAEQLAAVEQGEPVPITIGRTECVMVRKDRFHEVQAAYDDREWSEEEMTGLAEQTFDGLDHAKKECHVYGDLVN